MGWGDIVLVLTLLYLFITSMVGTTYLVDKGVEQVKEWLLRRGAAEAGVSVEEFRTMVEER